MLKYILEINTISSHISSLSLFKSNREVMNILLLCLINTIFFLLNLIRLKISERHTTTLYESLYFYLIVVSKFSYTWLLHFCCDVQNDYQIIILYIRDCVANIPFVFLLKVFMNPIDK